MTEPDLHEFARRYTAAWCSQNPGDSSGPVSGSLTPRPRSRPSPPPPPPYSLPQVTDAVEITMAAITTTAEAQGFT